MIKRTIYVKNFESFRKFKEKNPEQVTDRLPCAGWVGDGRATGNKGSNYQ